MAIEKIGPGAQPVSPATKAAGVKSGQKQSANESADSVELSEEAKLLFAAEKAKRIGQIRAKVRNGFYDKSEVTERVVDGLIKDLKATPNA